MEKDIEQVVSKKKQNQKKKTINFLMVNLLFFKWEIMMARGGMLLVVNST